MALKTGDRVAGKYRVEGLLGAGGMGAVYVAENERLRKRVALKVLGDSSVAPGSVDRFVREAIAASSVKHPGIVEIYDADVHEGTPWIAMELLEGETLGQRIERAGALPVDEAIDVALEALAAIGAVHAAGIVHRDLKPDNLFLEQLPGGRRRVKVLDFGIAKVVDHELGAATKTGTAMGTPYYLAPEQATNAKGIDARADVYAMGAILFRALTGQLPYEADTFGELVRQMYTSGPRPLATIAPHVPPAVAAVVARCLSVDPASRPASAEALAAELTQARAGQPQSSVPKTVAFEAPPPGSVWGQGSPPQQSSPQQPASGAVWGPPSTPAGAPSGGVWSAAPQYGSPPDVPPQFAPPQRSSGGGGLLVLFGGLAVAGVMALGIAGLVVYIMLSRGDDDSEIVEPVVDPIPTTVGSTSVSSLGLPGATAERLRAEVPVNAPQRGPSDALVTIVMWSDYQCPFCNRVEPTLAQLRQTYGNDLRVVWRDNPLPFHQNAMPAAELAREAYAQGGNDRYWQMHDVLFENQQALSRADLEGYAPRLGLDVARVRTALDGHTHRAAVQADMTAAGALGARGTPAFFINGRQLMGAQPYERFDEIVTEELALARALVARGVSRDRLYATFIAEARTTPAPQADAPTPSARRQPDPAAIYRVPLADSPARGSNEALVTIVEISEFQCPFCNRAQATLSQIRDHYGSDVRIVFKHNPLPFHQNAMPAAEASMEVLAQGGPSAFWRYHDTLFANQRDLTRENLELWARQLGGIDMARFRRALDAHTHQARIQQDQSLAQSLGASGTPAFFINGRNLRGAQPFEAFQRVIDEEMTRARAALAQGTPRAQLYDALTRDGHTTPQFVGADAPSNPTPSVAAPDADRVYAIPVPQNAPSRGPASARVTIQVFSDFQCPFCGRVRPTLDQLVERYPRDVRIVWRNYPLPFHQNAEPAAEAAMEVYAQAGDAAFWRYHDLLFENQRELTRPSFERWAQQVGGVDMARFRRALDAHTHRASIQADMSAVQSAGARIGTPSFFINGRLLQGAQPLPAFEAAVDRALRESR